MKYTIVGCITKYSVEQIKPFVESIRQSGFNGEMIMLVYDITDDVIEYLHTNDWILIQSELQEHIILQRFRDMFAFLHQHDTDVIIWTDVKDVVFQKDPTNWLDIHMKGEILALSESVIMKDEPWACINSGTSFPMEWELGLKDQISYCAGTIIGKKEAIRDLFIDIYRWSKTTSNPQQLSDQAAYNVLIHLNQYKNIVQFVNQEEGLATQLGVVFMRDETQKVIEPKPVYKDGKFYNQNGNEFVIVHQYDRNPKIREEIISKYK
jgi:hypothetical protein